MYEYSAEPNLVRMPTQQDCTWEQDNTCRSRLPERYTVNPLHLNSCANKNAAATSFVVAVGGKLMVFDTPLSLCRWKTACIRT